MSTKFADKVLRMIFIFVFVMGTILAPHQNAKAQEPIINIVAWPDCSWVQANGWTMGTLVTMKIDDPGTQQPVDYTAQARMGANPQNPEVPIAKFDMWGKFVLKAGHMITMEGEDGTIMIYTVTQLQVTSIDLQNDTVTGIATPGSQVQVWVDLQDRSIVRNVTAGEYSGIWTANYHIGT